MSSRSHRFARNVSAGLAGQGLVALLGFVLTPMLIRLLGLEGYGLYVLMQAATSYLLLGTLGAGSAAVKYTAEHAVHGGRAFHETQRLSVVLHLGGAAVAAALLFAAAPWFAERLFRVPAELMAPGVFMLRCAAVGGVFVAGTQAASSTLQGLQAFGAHNRLVVAQAVLMTGGAVGLAALGFGVNGVGRWHVLLSAVVFLVAVYVARAQAAPAAAHHGGKALDRRAFVAYGLSLWGGSLAWVITNQADKVVIAQAASLSALTLYAVPAGLLQRLQLLPAVVSTVLLPMFSELRHGDAEHEETARRMYLKSTRFVLFAVLPPLVVLFCVMPQFLGLWVGGHFSDASVWPARLLVAAQGFTLFNYVANAAAAARGRVWYVSAVNWGQALVSLAGWALFVPRHGLLGVALGSLLAQALPAFAYLFAVHRLLRVGWGSFFAEALAAPAAAALVLLVVAFPPHALATTWPRMISLGVIGLLAFYVTAWVLMPADDRRLALKLVGGGA